MRYLPLTANDRQAMLAKIGAPDIDALFRDVPKEAVVPLSSFDLSQTKGEMEVERILAKLESRNLAAGAGPFFCGAGAYKHHVPSAVDHLIQRSEFLPLTRPISRKSRKALCRFCSNFRPRWQC